MANNNVINWPHNLEYLNRRYASTYNQIVRNEAEEEPLMRRNVVELLSAMVPVIACKVLDVKGIYPLYEFNQATGNWQSSLEIALPITALALFSYAKTLIKRNPYQDRGIELSERLHTIRKEVKKKHPQAKWCQKDRRYDEPVTDKIEPKLRKTNIPQTIPDGVFRNRPTTSNKPAFM